MNLGFYFKNQEIIRKKLLYIIKREPKALTRVSRDIGISQKTLNKFLEDHEIQRTSLIKILAYIDKKENIINCDSCLKSCLDI